MVGPMDTTFTTHPGRVPRKCTCHQHHPRHCRRAGIRTVEQVRILAKFHEKGRKVKITTVIDPVVSTDMSQ